MLKRHITAVMTLLRVFQPTTGGLATLMMSTCEHTVSTPTLVICTRTKQRSSEWCGLPQLHV